MMHICTVATLCFPEKTVPRNYYYCVQDDNSLSLCFKSMYRTLFVAIFTSTFIFSMYDHIGLPGCVFPYLSKYKYQQSSALILSQVQCQRLCRGTSPTAREQKRPRLCCSSFHQGETCQTNDLTFPGIHRCWGSRWIQLPLLCAHPPPWSTSLDSTCLLTKAIVRCSCLNCRR